MSCSTNEMGVYLHFPFCRSKCGYCDFASQATDAIPQQRYTEAVLRELELRAATYAEKRLATIYFGGGTPSLWTAAELARVIRALKVAFPVADGLEVTVEANPGRGGPALWEALLEAGANRLSLGLQSLDDTLLRRLTRIHDRRQAIAAVEQARAAGFHNISCDLMFGLVGQSVAHHLDQLRQLLALEPNHVSAYALSLNQRVPLYQAGWRPAPDDQQAEMMEAGRDLLTAAGLPQYEVSNFAPPAYQSRHNTLVWAGHPYLGLGASAHSMFFSGPTTFRVANPELTSYLMTTQRFSPPATSQSFPVLSGATLESLDPPEACFELLFLGLRTTAGVDRCFYRARFGVDPLAHWGPALIQLQDRGWLTLQETRIVPTAQGIWFADELALRLLP